MKKRNVPLASVEPLERVDVGAAAFGEGERGARRRAGGVEGRAQRRSLRFRCCSGWRAARRFTHTARRRGVA